MTNAGFLVGCLFGLVLHELGHVLAGRALGLAIRRVGINWRGPYVVRERGSAAENIMVSAAGPLVNLALFAVSWSQWPSFALANLVLALTNFLPTSHSDGGQIVRQLSLIRIRS